MKAWFRKGAGALSANLVDYGYNVVTSYRDANYNWIDFPSYQEAESRRKLLMEEEKRAPYKTIREINTTKKIISPDYKEPYQACEIAYPNFSGPIVCQTEETGKANNGQTYLRSAVVFSPLSTFNNIPAKEKSFVQFYSSFDSEVVLEKLQAQYNSLEKSGKSKLDKDMEELYGKITKGRYLLDHEGMIRTITLKEDSELALWGVSQFVKVPKGSKVKFMVLAQGEANFMTADSRVYYISLGGDMNNPLLGSYKKFDTIQVGFNSDISINSNFVHSTPALGTRWNKIIQ
jgi:hypothetical protein